MVLKKVVPGKEPTTLILHMLTLRCLRGCKVQLLISWKNRSLNKPLLIVRFQICTGLMKEFGCSLIPH